MVMLASMCDYECCTQEYMDSLKKNEGFLLLCGDNLYFRALVLNPYVILKKEK